jgi:hypothetical protein
VLARLNKNAVTMLVIAAGGGGCRAVLNYPSPLGPRYTGGPATAVDPAGGRALRVVTYNVQWGKHIDRA